MAGNGSTADEQELLQEALRLSMEVDSTGIQSNSTTEVGGAQSRSTVSAGESAQMFALCLATVVYQQSLSPPVSQGPALMDQPGTEFPLFKQNVKFYRLAMRKDGFEVRQLQL